jgi:hypothetical protein
MANLILGNNNNTTNVATSPTRLIKRAGVSGEALRVVGDGVGIRGIAQNANIPATPNAGVEGVSVDGVGVIGKVLSANGVGVKGKATTNNSVGVLGLSQNVGIGATPNTGVEGIANTGAGVIGRSLSPIAGAGVRGLAENLSPSAIPAPAKTGVEGVASTGAGIIGRTIALVSGVGVRGLAENILPSIPAAPKAGVEGLAKTGAGVIGRSLSTSAGVGVRGLAENMNPASTPVTPKTGVEGIARTGVGVVGKTAANNGIGVRGVAQGSIQPPTPGTGVEGVSVIGIGVVGSSEQSTGVKGLANTGIGVSGLSQKGTGVLGSAKVPAPKKSPASVGIHGAALSAGRNPGTKATDPNGTGVWGESAGGTGVFGEGNIGVHGKGQTAGWFEGTVKIDGLLVAENIQVSGNLTIPGDIICDGTIYCKPRSSGTNKYPGYNGLYEDTNPTWNEDHFAMWYWPSDSRLKRSVTTIPHAIASVKRLRGVSFRWNKAGLQYITSNSDKRNGKSHNNISEHLVKQQMGFIAQEVERVFPGSVATDKNGYKMINTGILSAVLVNAIKEQQDQIEAQKRAIEEMRATVSEWEKRIRKLEAAGPQPK